jgi:6,7-dimethyl-8-ribityllumazine synthase
MPTFQPEKMPTSGRPIAVVASRFNEEYTGPLLAGCLARLAERGFPASGVFVARVPGAFEVPVAARKLALERHQGVSRFAAVVCLGVLLKGETPHFDYISQACSLGIEAAARESGVPCAFGVLTCETEAQVRERLGGAFGHKGAEAADAALEMAALFEAIERSHTS